MLPIPNTLPPQETVDHWVSCHNKMSQNRNKYRITVSLAALGIKRRKLQTKSLTQGNYLAYVVNHLEFICK